MSDLPSSTPAPGAGPERTPGAESAPHELPELPDLIRTDGPQRTAVVRIVLLVAAGFFFVLGVVGWLVPVVTGIPFYVLAAICLGMADRRFARWINKHERRLPAKVRHLLRRRRNAADDRAAKP